MQALEAGRAAEAAALFREWTAADPKDAEAWHGLGRALAHLEDGTASEAFATAITLRPDSVAIRQRFADLELKHGHYAEALTLCERVLELTRAKPSPATYVTAARALCELHRFEDALAAITSALRLDPENADAFVALALLFEEQGKPLDAFAAYQKALSIRPRDVLAYNNLAGILIGQRQFDLAVSTARVAVSLAPNHADVYLNLATALRLRGDEAEAIATYKAILALKPNHGEALVELCHRRQHACDWTGLEEQQDASRRESYRKGCRVSPFAIMTSTASPLEQQLCARVWGDHFKPLAATPLAPYAPRPIAARGRKIRLGYLSADLHSHATAMLIVEVLELHDRSRFELFAYSLGPDDDSAMRRRLVAAFDRFVDLRSYSDADAAKRIRADEIDILLDLKGYTQNARVKILAYEPAPIQVNYLGFPGTMGAGFIDYIIADKHVAPMRDAALFDEAIVHLPNCYQPNDRERVGPREGLTRAGCGLPETAVVFCCFNNPYKITPEVFGLWMRLLEATPEAVLWLLVVNDQAADNLRREAMARGIAAERLVFAPFAAPEVHLARLGLADLFLDTVPVNAHTTASDALWMGLPIVTRAGEAFASRVAGSLLHAVGLDSLVTTSLAAYEALALDLARHPAKRRALRERLARARVSAPLFDTPLYVQHYETALTGMMDRKEAGLPPAAFAVTERRDEP